MKKIKSKQKVQILSVYFDHGQQKFTSLKFSAFFLHEKARLTWLLWISDKKLFLSTMAAFGNYCQESIQDKSQFEIPTSKKIRKNKSTFVTSAFQIDMMPWFFVFFLVGIYLSQILSGQKFRKAAFVLGSKQKSWYLCFIP